MNIRPKIDSDLDWMHSLLKERWGSIDIVSRNHLHKADTLPGFIAVDDDQAIGLITFAMGCDDCEIVTLDSLIEGKGIGTTLVRVVMDKARENNCQRIWCITTNDNTGAIQFYQKIGFTLATVHKDAIIESRKLKPIIPEIGHNGVPIKDEVEFEFILR